jgi:probable phosphoglycerate mutase
MEIFFVRHGQTGGNVAKRHQAEDTPLTFKGEEQVRIAAQKIKDLNPTHIITSNLVRTVDTAKVIGQVCNLVPETSIDLIELKRPKELYGNYHFSLRSLAFYINWYLGRKTKGFSGGETYSELLERIKKVKNKFSELPGDSRVVVVSHSVFMNFFLAHLCDDRKMNPLRAALVFKNMLMMPNAHIIPITHNASVDVDQCAWSRET